MKYEKFEIEEENSSFFWRNFKKRRKAAAVFIGTLMILSASLVFSVHFYASKKVETCASRPCQNSGSCVFPTTGSMFQQSRTKKKNSPPECSCLLGFSGEFCEITPCTEVLCQNGGSCEVKFEGYQQNYVRKYKGISECACTAEFYGTYCDYPVQLRTTTSTTNITERPQRHE